MIPIRPDAPWGQWARVASCSSAPFTVPPRWPLSPGYTFVVYKHDPNDPGSLSSSFIQDNGNDTSR
jgi:hypothetical protein